MNKKPKKSPILRVHDFNKSLLDYVARPAKRPRIPITCELDQLLSGVLQILKKDAFCIIIELNL